MAQAAKVYAKQLREEVNAEREKLRKPPIEEDEDDDDKGAGGGSTKEISVSTTDPESGMFVKGEHERQFAYEAHTACDKRGYILGVKVTAGNVHDSVAWDELYEDATGKLDVKYIATDAGYKTPWIAKKTLDGGTVPILPHTRSNGKKGGYRPWEYSYDPVTDEYICPQGGRLRHTTTDREGKRAYRSDPKHCKGCPYKGLCGANEKGQKWLTKHIWQKELDLVEQIRKTDLGKEIYSKRRETIESLCRCQGKTRHALYPLPKSGPSDKLGEA